MSRTPAPHQALDPVTGKTGQPCGFKRDSRDLVLALRSTVSGELIRPDGTPLPFAEGFVLLKRAGGGYAVITPAMLEALADRFRYPRITHGTKFAIAAGLVNLISGF